MTNQKTKQIKYIIGIFIIITFLPAIIHAQATAEESPVTQEQIKKWYSPEDPFIKSEISKLDEQREENVPFPILFGLTPNDLTRNFGDPRPGGRTHEGLDIMAPMRAPAVSPTNAVVLRIGYGESAGNYVYTVNPGGETFVYMHLDEIADIRETNLIDKGDLIGYVGNTGNAIGGSPHLHFEIHDSNGKPTDPFPRLGRIFPLQDKVNYLVDILDEREDEISLAKDFVSLYRKDFEQIQSLDISLPLSITDALASKTTSTTMANDTTKREENITPMNTEEKTEITSEANTEGTVKLVKNLEINRTLKIGSRGEDVSILQTALDIPADGIFGPQTKASVMNFQKSKNLVVDGIFGPKSLLALNNTGGDLPSGCTSSTIYSPTTGARCVVGA